MKYLGIIMLLGVGVFLTSCNSQNESGSENTSLSQNTDMSNAPQETTGGKIEKETVYMSYSEDALTSEKINVLQFHADWCPSCVALEKNLSEEEIPQNLNLLEVDYDNATDLKKKYGVTMQHTSVIVDEDGNELAQFSGIKNVNDYMTKLEEAGISSSSQSDNSEVSQNNNDSGATMNEDDTQDEQELSSMSGEYTEYSENLIGATDDTVLFFHASWCPSCSAADTGIKAELEDIPKNLTILKTDYDTSTELRKKYGVVAQHTFVQVDANGNEIKKWVGGTSVDDIVEKI